MNGDANEGQAETQYVVNSEDFYVPGPWTKSKFYEEEFCKPFC